MQSPPYPFPSSSPGGPGRPARGQVSYEAAGGGGAGPGEAGCDDAGGALVHGHQEDDGYDAGPSVRLRCG